MTNRPPQDPLEATLRDLRGAVYTGDGRAAMAAIERRSDLETPQYVGDGLRLALAQGVAGAPLRAAGHIAALRDRDLDGDEDLALELEVMLGLAQAPALRGLPIDSDYFDEFGESTDREVGEADDRRRGRVRQWLAGSGLRPTVPGEPASPGGPDLHGLP